MKSKSKRRTEHFVEVLKLKRCSEVLEVLNLKLKVK